MLKNKIIIVVIGLLMFSNCQLIGDLDDVDPGFLVTPEIAIRDAASAENVLAGVYSRFRKDGFQGINEIGSYWGISGITSWTGQSILELNNNNPTLNNGYITDFYLNCYSVISQVNSFKTGLKALSTNEITETDKQALLAESDFLRASAYFYALRFFGQHYDLSSEFGIVIRPEDSANDANAFPRSSVQESYDAILEDLDYAIAHGPENGGPNFRASKEAAQALKAKVLLYMGDFPAAAALANSVLTNTTKSFAPDYAEMFTDQINSPEIFFAPFTDSAEDPFGRFSPIDLEDSLYETLAITADDPRLNTQKFWFQFDGDLEGDYEPPFYRSTNVHLRLPELYLIHAEAAARAGSGVEAAALASLNASRTRSAVGLPALVSGVDINTKAELLEAIRIEKLFELFSEQGEEFFDIVRYHSLGDLDGLSIKTSLDSEHLFILPIPLKELKPSQGVVVQNPGYPSGI